MRFKLLVCAVILLAVALGGQLFYRISNTIVAQEPQRGVIGDTLWLKIDSTHIMRYDRLYGDSMFVIMLPLHNRMELQVGFSPTRESLPRIEFNYSIPYWSVYRRSFRVWGITFSTGQVSPYAPYHAGNSLDATVLSFPLQPPR